MPDCPWCGEPLTPADDCDGRCVNGHEWWDETGSSAVTYWVEKMCPRTDAPELPCNIREVEHLDQPGTGILMCHPHGEIVGRVDG